MYSISKFLYTTIILVSMIFTSNFIYSQSPEGINYQAVFRNPNGTIVAGQQLSCRIELVQGNITGVLIYSEKHGPTTNQQGIANFVIGAGTPIQGVFSNIDWGSGPYYMKLYVDFDAQGATFQMQQYGVQQLISVPYALHSKVADSITGGLTTGPQGIQGEEGPQGIQGDQGPQGIQGNQGVQGDQGIQGQQGIQGIQGDQGVQGPPGLDIVGSSGQTIHHNGTDWSASSMIYNDGSKVGIGTTSPDDDLDVSGNVQIDNGYLRVGDPPSGIAVKRGSKVFVDGSNVSVEEGTNQYTFTWNLGLLNKPQGASTFTVQAVTFNCSGYDGDYDEDSHIFVKIGSNTAGWTTSSGLSFNGGAFDWNYAVENLGWTYSSDQTVQFEIYDGWGWPNDDFDISNIEATVYYEYSSAMQEGEIAAEGRIYANSLYEVGDLAEHFELNTQVFQSGMVVSFVPGSENEYKLSDNPNDNYLVGVISENPSVILNSAKVGPPVAMTGRVKIKLKPTERLIRSGDYLTSSDNPGLAQLSNRSGPVIGYAVTNQQAGEDEVEIFLLPGVFHMPKSNHQKRIKTINNKPIKNH